MSNLSFITEGLPADDWIGIMETVPAAPGMISFQYRAYNLAPVPAAHRTAAGPALAWKRTEVVGPSVTELSRGITALLTGDPQ